MTKKNLEYYQHRLDTFKFKVKEKEGRVENSVSILEEEAKRLYTSLEEKCKEVEESKKELVKYNAKTYHLIKEKMEIQSTYNVQNVFPRREIAINAGVYKSSQIARLWLAIEQMHLTCLKNTKSKKAAQCQKLIEDKVYQYLSLAPHPQRFCCEQVWEVLLLSSQYIPNFSPLYAAKAFKLIEKFAAKLINLKIKNHSRTEIQKDFIEKHIYGAQKLFMQMGYQFMSTGENILVLDAPVQKDCIISVARDCRIAQTECRIIDSIFRSATDHCQCTWKDVLDYRFKYIGTPQQVTNKLVKCKKRHSV